MEWDGLICKSHLPLHTRDHDLWGKLLMHAGLYLWPHFVRLHCFEPWSREPAASLDSIDHVTQVH